MITKRSKVYVPYLYAWIKYKSITVYIKNKKGGGSYIIISKGTVQYWYVSKECTKQTKTNEEEWDERRKPFKLYNHNKICFLFPFLFIFHPVKLLNIHKKSVCFVFIS